MHNTQLVPKLIESGHKEGKITSVHELKHQHCVDAEHPTQQHHQLSGGTTNLSDAWLLPLIKAEDHHHSLL